LQHEPLTFFSPYSAFQLEIKLDKKIRLVGPEEIGTRYLVGQKGLALPTAEFTAAYPKMAANYRRNFQIKEAKKRPTVPFFTLGLRNKMCSF
jgi:hypothetical protein